MQNSRTPCVCVNILYLSNNNRSDSLLINIRHNICFFFRSNRSGNFVSGIKKTEKSENILKEKRLEQLELAFYTCLVFENEPNYRYINGNDDSKQLAIVYFLDQTHTQTKLE